MAAKKKHYTPEHLKAASLAPQAILSGWTSSRLAEEAGVGKSVAQRVLREHAVRYTGQISKVLDRRVEVARQAQETALSRLPRLQMLLERAEEALEKTIPTATGEDGVPVALDQFGQPIPIDPQAIIKAMGGLIKAGKELHSYTEQVTGMDVVKAVAVRQQTQGPGPINSWDGIGAMEAAIEAEIVPTSQSVAVAEDWE